MNEVGEKVSLPVSKHIIAQILETLTALHRSSIIHGDPRLANVVFVNNQYKWIDFCGQLVFHRTNAINYLVIFFRSTAGVKVDDVTLETCVAKYYDSIQNGIPFDILGSIF